MGMLSDFVIAGQDDGPAIGASDRPADTWATLEAKGVDMIKLSTLYCAATGAIYSNELQESFEFVGGDEEEGPWVVKFPAQILSGVASISADQIDGVAAIWAQSEELRMGHWTTAEASQFIALLNVHAQKAIASGSALYLWMSL